MLVRPPPSKKSVKKRPAKKGTGKKGTAKKSGPPKSAAQIKREREIYKVSPLRGMAIADYIAKRLTGWQAEATRRLVAMVARIAPSSTVSIKWSQPVFEENGPFAFIKPAKAHLSFGFWRGAELADPDRLLAAGDRMGHIKYTSLEAIDEEALARLVHQAVLLNRKKGSPTRRG
jgi:hypothetical protein